MKTESAHRNGGSRWLAVAVAGLMTLGLSQAAAALDVTLKVEETAGVARAKDACRTGIPIPPGALKDTKNLRLLDAKGAEVPAQFRVMNRRLSGDIEWVCVNFLADVAAKGAATYRLTDDGPASAVNKPVTVEDGDVSLVVTTGPLKVAIPKKVFAGLGEVWFDRDGDGRFGGDERVSTGGALVVEGMDGKVYRSVSDLTAPLSVRVVERGPVLVVVRIDGEVKAQSAGGKAHTYPHLVWDKDKVAGRPTVVLENEDLSLGFTVRLHFWKGQSWVRAFVTMRNLNGQSSTGTDKNIRYTPYYAATIKKPGNLLVDAINVELDLVSEGELGYRFGGGVEGNAVHVGTLAASDRGVVLYQDTSAGWLWQTGSGKIFDPLLKRNQEMMALQGVDRAYWEYQPVWYDHLYTRRDGASFIGYRVQEVAKEVPPDRFAAFDERLMAVPDARHNLASRVYGDFMLPNPEEWPRYEKSALTAVVCGVDPGAAPGTDSSFAIEREKHDHYGVWRFGDHSKGGYHHFSQYLELDVPYCLMIHLARASTLAFYREAEIACRQVLDVPAHGGGYGHQRGESSHYYTYGNLLFSYVTGEPWLKEAVRASYLFANTRPWHLRSFGVTMWSSLDVYFHFPEDRKLAKRKIDACVAWWKKVHDQPTGRLGGFDRSWKTFFLGIGTDAMGRYCEAFPEDKEARKMLVAACREWIEWTKTLDQEQRNKILAVCPGNGFAYATRFSGDETFLNFAAKHLVTDERFRARYRAGTASGKGWSQFGHRLTQVFLHDLDKKRHPEKYKGLP